MFAKNILFKTRTDYECETKATAQMVLKGQIVPSSDTN